MNIVFENGADELFREQTWDHPSLNDCIISLMRWNGDNTIHIHKDFIAKSFYFTEHTKDGKVGMNGGIVLHADGKYQIHT